MCDDGELERQRRLDVMDQTAGRKIPSVDVSMQVVVPYMKSSHP